MLTQVLDLLKGLLKFNFKERLTVQMALQHPYLSVLHSEEDEVL